MEEKKNSLDVKTNVTIEVTKEDRVYRFSIPAGAPFGESFDAAFEALEMIRGWYDKAQEKMKENRPKDEDNEENN